MGPLWNHFGTLVSISTTSQIWDLTGSSALSLRHPNDKASRMSPCVTVFIDDYSSYQEMLLHRAPSTFPLCLFCHSFFIFLRIDFLFVSPGHGSPQQRIFCSQVLSFLRNDKKKPVQRFMPGANKDLISVVKNF